MKKQPSLATCVFVCVFCAVVSWRLGVVFPSGMMLVGSFWKYGFLATIPNLYAVYSLAVLVSLVGIKVYVWFLARDAKEYFLDHWADGFGIS
jgi:hypothetical protein